MTAEATSGPLFRATLSSVSPVTHFFAGWVLAAAAGRSRRERVLITAAAVVPDVDGLGAIAELATRHSSHPLLWFSRFHHSLHTLAFACVVAVLCFALSGRSWRVAAWAFLSFHLHLLADIVGARGPDGYVWPIQYLLPFSGWELSWQGQWSLNGWQNLVITVALLVATVLLARVKGISPVELFSPRADAAVVRTLRSEREA